jgi:hypothetical protein
MLLGAELDGQMHITHTISLLLSAAQLSCCTACSMFAAALQACDAAGC